jgi:hypothetical protein
MSCQFATETHIRALVTAMREATDDRAGIPADIPFPPEALTQLAPEAFEGYRRDKATGWPFTANGREGELGRALWLANSLAYSARYKDGQDHAQALAYRHAQVEADPVTLIKAFQFWAYQCAEDHEAARTWAEAVSAGMIKWLIPRLPGYEAAPWGLPDRPVVKGPKPAQPAAPKVTQGMFRIEENVSRTPGGECWQVLRTEGGAPRVYLTRESAEHTIKAYIGEGRGRILEGLDEKDAQILADRIAARERIKGPRIGDVVDFDDGTSGIFSHDWGDSIQWSEGGSIHLNAGGGGSFSGGLNPPIFKGGLIATGETRLKRFWFFHHGSAGAHRGVDVLVPCRVYRHAALTKRRA